MARDAPYRAVAHAPSRGQRTVHAQSKGKPGNRHPATPRATANKKPTQASAADMVERLCYASSVAGVPKGIDGSAAKTFLERLKAVGLFWHGAQAP
jgi:hypothetical protein